MITIYRKVGYKIGLCIIKKLRYSPADKTRDGVFRWIKFFDAVLRSINDGERFYDFTSCFDVHTTEEKYASSGSDI